MEDPKSESGRPSSATIDALTAGLRPVRPLKMSHVYALCLGVQLLVSGIAAWAFGLDARTLDRLSEPTFLAVVVVLALSAAACTVVAARSAVPGRGVKRWLSAVLLLVPLLLATWVWLASPWGGAWMGLATLFGKGKACMAEITGVAVFPWLATLLVLRLLAPLREYATGMFVGLSAFLIGAVAVQLACDVTDHYHLAVTHYLWTLVGAVLAGVVSGLILRVRPQS